ncbi:ABC transporter ATP-binding protein [Myroides marinus]|uniref:ATP-binding cassette, subfamily B, MsbA n=1 Tax=Myroides marinus TaxID=703342 RepID=A0A1H6Y463_9FLAO|nr:ABC transporter ATP-binding protein [Myroides marinus]KUF39053.1 antibiotic ABC transporter ATP-binding protein [Myroides marinus]MDM1376901.1 ABC transporter ATP-binding protein [Myroides marinus]MDM1380571.1 ABC transporter ATP-binding protein [Myroides marinus]MDM1383906.1 ABC transporter ATP-binding protein [Myroides marinus]MDM1387843.1 ABC transporter ATP-binding protein [Myroides marinus]
MNEYFKKIIYFAKPYKSYAYLNIFFNILYALFSALSFVALIPMLTVLFHTGEKITEKPVYQGITSAKDYLEQYMSYFITMYSDEHGAQNTLMVMAALIISLFLLKNLFNYWAMYFITFLRNGVLKDIRNAMFKKSLELPLSFFSEKRKGDIISRITSDVLEIQHSFLSILEVLVREPLTIVFTIVVMFGISTELTIFVFIFVPISGIIISKVGKSLKKSSQKASEEQGYFLSIIEESLSGLKVIKSFNSEKTFNDKFQDSTMSFYDLNNKILNRQNLSSPLSEFLGIVTIAVLLVYGGHLVLGEGTLTSASFIAYIGMAYNILTPAKAMSKASYSLKRGNAAAERVLQVLEEENPIVSKENAIAKADFEKEIVVENISFKYEDEYVLKDFNLTVPKGKTVALVGQSGSGKSTIANLLTRFWDINEGVIKIDNQDIRDVKLDDLRGLIGLVTQDSILFNDTIKNNLKLGNQDATDEQIINALKIANAYEFVKDLPNGIDTNIGDAGNKLSGGQKQRLSIARAVLKNPPIMILDEATSALDTESEKLVQVALDNMMKNRTSIVIAHRLSTIQKADLIVVMQKGVIVEQGTHEELIQLNGTYSKLVTLQSLE